MEHVQIVMCVPTSTEECEALTCNVCMYSNLLQDDKKRIDTCPARKKFKANQS